jgi:hypothetical protein
VTYAYPSRFSSFYSFRFSVYFYTMYGRNDFGKIGLNVLAFATYARMNASSNVSRPELGWWLFAWT